MRIYAFGHRKYTGKDTACRLIRNYIKTNYPGVRVMKTSFAYFLKEECCKLFQLESPIYYEKYPHMKDEVIEKYGKSARQIWIEVGNKMREVYPLIWVDYVFKHVNSDHTDVCLISDLRYPNEADAIHARNGLCIKITRPIIEDTHDVADDALDHYTKWDYTIDNNSTVNGLYDKLTSFIDLEFSK